ncbi:MAG: hypothetical protein ACOY3H_08775 [Bacillota bacterium]|uniref:Flagellin, Flp1-like, domain n=2 Tax=Carboxydocella TaxID=178898 RepID=A0A1T4M337_9FIRM|nr:MULTISPECIES: hypothetical protein [Carboxydocella]AVX21075.1 hypothetical protein CFE_1905 [Carboxydocella thermautotrophica]AVX31495.1 hypothetical protein CTH_1924 [Carboxydocella thermautotrophica]SJZ61124.1 hypothetical protein SAMN02745885_00396 [Carboxydocella sporoproducens DSM 16521]GAW28830.1 hypothetical protein ULO1_14000 [Carboxydocella sp. ULO1]GAW32722.1 hypothetical protein JDF658_24870 [Carboxydocella sp. JDF658]
MNRKWQKLLCERGDFVQNALYLALVVIFGIGVLSAFGQEIVQQFQAIIDKFAATRPR